MATLRAWAVDTSDPVAAIQQLAVIVALYYDRRDLVNLLLAGNGSVELWLHRPLSWPPSVCLIKQGGAYWLAMTGTQNISPQVLGHIYGSFARGGIPDGGAVNGQWLSVWGDVWDEVSPKIDGPLSAARIRMSGHSYGGAVAQVGSLVLRDQVADVQVMGFGAPKSVGAGYSGSIPTTALWSSYQDQVPNLPPDGATIAAATMWITPLVWFAANIAWDTYGETIPLGPDGTIGLGGETPDPLPPDVSIGPLTEHSTINYYGRLRAWYASHGSPPAMTLPLSLIAAAIIGQPVQPQVAELPHVVPGPVQEPEEIPYYYGLAVSPRTTRITMAYPSPRTGGTPYRITRLINQNANGWSETQLVYTSISQPADALAAVKATAAALNAARSQVLHTTATIVATRISIDNQPQSAAVYKSGGLGNIAGLRGGLPTQSKDSWVYLTRDLTLQVRGHPFIRGLAAADVAFPAGVTDRLKLAAPAKVGAWALDQFNILVGAENQSRPVVNGAFRSHWRDPSTGQNVYTTPVAWSISSEGYLQFITPTALTWTPPGGVLTTMNYGGKIEVKLNRNKCTVGQSGTYRVIGITPIAGTTQYTVNKRPCCPLASVAAFTGQVRPSVVIYVDLADVFAQTLTTHDTGGPFFSGAGRQKGRCC